MSGAYQQPKLTQALIAELSMQDREIGEADQPGRDHAGRRPATPRCLLNCTDALFGTYKGSRLALSENVATADLTRLTAEDFHLA